jgi:hypothetical protein
MEAEDAESPIYFEQSPILPYGPCGEFVSTGRVRPDPLHCGGAHPPPRCAWQCAIELHRWEQRGREWFYLDGAIH